MVVVIIIIAIISAIALPRFSNVNASTNERALSLQLKAIRNAILMYVEDHGGVSPTGPAVQTQRTPYTDAAGNTSPTRDAAHPFGPYLKEMPPLPVSANKGASKVAPADAPGVGWIYNPADGSVRANTPDPDARGKQYADY